MDVVVVVLRIVHIVSGVLWVGGAAVFFLYAQPTIAKLGPDAEKFVDEMVNRRRLPVYFLTASTLTVLAGVVMYWRQFGGINTSPVGLGFGLGGLAAIIAWLGGNILIPKTFETLATLAAEVRTSAGPPAVEVVARMQATQQQLRLIGMIVLALLGFAVVAMASARYLR